MASVTDLRTRDDADALLDVSQERPVFLLKHSLACPVSARGQRAFEALDADDDPPLYRVVVQTSRDVSHYLADVLDVRHETPQAVLLHGGQAVAVFNHYDIGTDALRAAARAHAASGASA